MACVVQSMYMLSGYFIDFLSSSRCIYQLDLSYDCSSAKNTCGYLVYGFNLPATLKLLYFTHMRSILEYGSQIWHPTYDIYTNTIEKVRRKFTRFFCYKFKFPNKTNAKSKEFLQYVLFDTSNLETRPQDKNVLMIFVNLDSIRFSENFTRFLSK